MPNASFLAFLDDQTDMARSTRVVILIKIYIYIYTLKGRLRDLLPVTYFLTNIVYPLALRETGLKIGLF